jgi:predicted CXXCH cytochrome family protein
VMLRRTIMRVGGAVTLLLLLAAGARSGERPVEHPFPEIKKNCALCHRDGSAPQEGLRKPVSGLCLDCHPERTAPAEHKVDIVPAMDVRGLPLTAGKITCVTCHDPHRNTFGSLLRKKQTDLCLSCHPY